VQILIMSFPDKYHVHTLQQLMDTCLLLQPGVEIDSILSLLIQRISEHASSNPTTKPITDRSAFNLLLSTARDCGIRCAPSLTCYPQTHTPSAPFTDTTTLLLLLTPKRQRTDVLHAPSRVVCIHASVLRNTVVRTHALVSIWCFVYRRKLYGKSVVIYTESNHPYIYVWLVDMYKTSDKLYHRVLYTDKVCLPEWAT
jgi:hypothetical protein